MYVCEYEWIYAGKINYICTIFISSSLFGPESGDTYLKQMFW